MGQISEEILVLHDTTFSSENFIQKSLAMMVKQEQIDRIVRV
jgi:hypothetical protein